MNHAAQHLLLGANCAETFLSMLITSKLTGWNFPEFAGYVIIICLLMFWSSCFPESCIMGVNYVGWVSLLINLFGPFCSYNFHSLPQLNANSCMTEPFLLLHCLLNGLQSSWQNWTFICLQLEGFKKRRKRFPVVYSEGKIMAAEGGAPVHGK